MITGWTQFGIYASFLLASLLINAMLVACESSMVRLRYRLSERDTLERIRQRKPVAFLFDRLATTAPIVRFGIMTATVGMGVILFRMLVFLTREGGLESWTQTVLFWLVLLIPVVSLISLFGYLMPRGIALQRPAGTLVACAWPVSAFVVLMLPWFQLQRALARTIFGIFRTSYADDFNIVDFEVQVQALSRETTAITPRILNISRNALRMSELDVSSVLLGRNQVRYFDLEDAMTENLKMARASGHTRFPLCHGDLDKCEGIIHIKDIFRSGKDPETLDLMAIKRDIINLHEEAPLEQALQAMLAQKVHMALVKDEFGGVVGIITLEGILEILIGDIEDEFDVETETSISKLGDGIYEIAGLTPVHELEEALGIIVESDDVSTFGGLITTHVGRIPEIGETLILEDPALEVSILEADDTRVVTARVVPITPEPDTE